MQQRGVAVQVERAPVAGSTRAAALPCSAVAQAVDILVPNAGLALGVAPVHELVLEDVRTMMETNGTAAVAL